MFAVLNSSSLTFTQLVLLQLIKSVIPFYLEYEPHLIPTTIKIKQCTISIGMFIHIVFFLHLLQYRPSGLSLWGDGGGGGLVNPVDIYVYTTIRNITIDID